MVKKYIFGKQTCISVHMQLHHVDVTSLSACLYQDSGHGKSSADATKPDAESWLMYIQFASLPQQHNLSLCQVDDQVCGDTRQ